MYIPVAEETFGGTPRLINSGLKITPPPSPRAPATHPPPKPRPRTILSVWPSKMRSLCAKLTLLNSFLSFYSYATNLVPTITNNNITIMKAENKIQSPAVHFSKPFVPLRKLTTIKIASSPKFIPYFFHTP
jgi:hypothetical protein